MSVFEEKGDVGWRSPVEKNNAERRFGVVAGLDSGGGADEHDWSSGTTRERGKTLKQQDKMRKNRKKGNR